MSKIKYNRIKAALAEAGRQSSELAAHMGVHITTVSDWCTNTNQPSIKDLYTIADYLKTNVRLLLVPNVVAEPPSYMLNELPGNYYVVPPPATPEKKKTAKAAPAKRGKKK
jgi:transcriptional regulator with XRE-family HTH domain